MSTETHKIRLQVDGKDIPNSVNDLAKAQKDLKKSLRGLEEGTGEYIKKSQKLKQISARHEEVRKKINDTGKAWKKQTSEFKEGITGRVKGMQVYGVSLGSLSKGHSAAASAIGGTNKYLKLFKVALASTGIGLILVALGSMVTYLKRTQGGQEILNKVMAQTGAIVDVILDRFGMLGNAAIKLFKGDFKGAAEVAKAAFKGVGEEIAADVELSGKLSDGMADIEKRQADLILKNAERARDVKALYKIADDVSKSATTRLEAANLAIATEQARMRDAVNLQRDKAELLQQEYDRSESLTSDLVELNTQKAMILELETTSLKLQTTLQAKRNILQAQLVKEGQIEMLDIEKKGAEDTFDVAKDLEERKTKLKAIHIETRNQLVREHTDVEIKSLDELYGASMGFLDAMTNINNMIALQGEEMAGFQKGLALFQIGINTAKAISDAIASATAAGLATGAAAPLTTPLFIATMLATVTGAFAQAHSVLGNSSQPSAPSFSSGGFTGQGNMGMGQNKGGYIRGVVEEDEFVINRNQMKDPYVSGFANYLESSKNLGGAADRPMNISAAASLDSVRFDAAVDRFEDLVTVLQKNGIIAQIPDRTLRDAEERNSKFKKTKARARL